MNPTEHIVEMKVGDIVIDTWQSYDIDHDLVSPADEFDMTFGAHSWDPHLEAEPIVKQLRDLATARARVELFVDGAKQLTGYIDDVHGEADGDGGTIQIKGRDVGGQVVDENMPLGFNIEGLRLVEVLALVLTKWNILVVIGNEGNRKVVSTKTKSYTVEGKYGSAEVTAALESQPWWKKKKKVETYSIQTQEDAETQIEAAFNQHTLLSQPDTPLYGAAFVPSFGLALKSDFTTAYYEVVNNRKIEHELKVEPGQTRWDWISKLLKTQNLLGWFSADGKFIVGTPRYDQDPLFHATRAVEYPGIPLGKRTPSMNNIESGGYTTSPGARYSHVYVHGHQGKDPIKAVAVDQGLVNLGVDRPSSHTDHDIKSIEEAQRVADRRLVDSKIKGNIYTCKMTGHGQGDRLYAIDTIVDVWDDDPAVYIHELLYCTRLRFSYSLEEGPSTVLTLQPKGIIEVPTE